VDTGTVHDETTVAARSSAENAQEAAQADERYLTNAHLTGDYADGYYSHNLHFLWSSLMMEGRSADALKAAASLGGFG